MESQNNRFLFSGIPVDVLNRKTAVARIIELAGIAAPSYICVNGAHGILESRKDPAFRKALLEAAVVTPDGAPLAWFGRLTGHPTVRKVTGWPLVYGVFDDIPARANLRHYFLGSTKAVTDAMTSNLSSRSPGCAIVGACNPPFRPITDDELAEIAHDIKAKGANVIWIGLGAPRQELLANRLAHLLDNGVLIACGAAFDFVAGNKPIVPDWISALGMEWLFRLISEPRRLWRRYLVVVPRFFGLFFVELAHHYLRRILRPAATAQP